MNKVAQYELIDWNIPNTQYRQTKPVYMTTDEARELNKKLVEVKTTKRYVKDEVKRMYYEVNNIIKILKQATEF